MKQFTGWFGAIKALQPRMLSAGFCVDVVNMRPGRGDLRPWNTKLDVATLPAGRVSFYRMGRDLASDTNYWLSSTVDVDYARSMLANDPTERTYYTGQSEPRVTDNILALAGAPYPTSYRILGIPAPITPMAAAITTVGVAADSEDRYYVDIFISDQDEKGPPGVPTARLTCKTDAEITLTSLSAAPAGAYGITLRGIYRTRVATDGTADFFLIAKVPATDTTFVDTGAADGEILESDGGGVGLAWDPPPSGLRGIIGLWNGMMGGFVGKSVRVCWPYKPHAWPALYEAVTQSQVVATGTFGTTWVVLTTDKPYALSGSSPGSLVASMDPIKAGHSCISKRSVVSFKHGVVWASPRGLAYMGANGPTLLTEKLFLEEDWKALNPASMIGCQFEGLYFGFYTVGGVKKGFIINPLTPAAVIFLDSGADAAWFDPVSESMYVLNGTAIQKWNAGDSLMTASATSRVDHDQAAENFGVAQVLADAYPVTLAIYGDYGVLRCTVTAISKEPVTLPGGFDDEDHQVKVTSAVGGVQAVILADDYDELGRA